MISHGNKRFQRGGSSSRLGSELASAGPGLSSASSTFCEVSQTCLEGRAETGGSLRHSRSLFEASVPSVPPALGPQRAARSPRSTGRRPGSLGAAPRRPQGGSGGSAESRRAQSAGGQTLHSGGVGTVSSQECGRANFRSSSLTSLWVEFSILTAQQNHLENLKNV